MPDPFSSGILSFKLGNGIHSRQNPRLQINRKRRRLCRIPSERRWKNRSYRLHNQPCFVGMFRQWYENSAGWLFKGLSEGSCLNALLGQQVLEHFSSLHVCLSVSRFLSVCPSLWLSLCLSACLISRRPYSVDGTVRSKNSLSCLCLSVCLPACLK